MVQLMHSLNRNISIGSISVYYIDTEKRQGKCYYNLEINGDKLFVTRDETRIENKEYKQVKLSSYTNNEEIRMVARVFNGKELVAYVIAKIPKRNDEQVEIKLDTVSKERLIEIAKNTNFNLQNIVLSGENISGASGFEFKFLPRFNIMGDNNDKYN